MGGGGALCISNGVCDLTRHFAPVVQNTMKYSFDDSSWRRPNLLVTLLSARVDTNKCPRLSETQTTRYQGEGLGGGVWGGGGVTAGGEYNLMNVCLIHKVLRTIIFSSPPPPPFFFGGVCVCVCVCVCVGGGDPFNIPRYTHAQFQIRVLFHKIII